MELIDLPVISGKKGAFLGRQNVPATEFWQYQARKQPIWDCNKCWQTLHMKKIRVFYGWLSLSTLIVGMVIYLLFRDVNNMVLFSWIPKPEFLGAILVPLKPSVFSSMIRYNLPDMLWFVSAILFLRFIWFYENKTQTVYICCFYGIGLILEISQLSKKVPGTFDWLDLFSLGIGAFVESLLYKKLILRRHQ